MDKKLTWLKQLSETCGVSGFETSIKNLLQKRLQGKAKVSYAALFLLMKVKARTCQKLCLPAIWMKLVLWLSI